MNSDTLVCRVVPESQKNRTRSSRLRKLMFSAFTVVACFAALEWGLGLAGINPVVEVEDPYVGFSSYFPLFAADPDDPGRMVTAQNKLAYFNSQSFVVPKLKNQLRIFTVGGSTCYGRPYDDATSFSGWLRLLLPRASAAKTCEVINAGGISYASYRVARVMEELIQYEPDLFIIYCGHNEFLEHRTYTGLRDSSSALTAVGSLLSHTRTYSAMRKIITGSSASAPSSSGTAYQLPGEVVTLLDGSVGPRDYHRNETLKRQIQQHYELNLRRMVQIARDAGSQVLLIVPASNLKDMSPFKMEFGKKTTPRQRQEVRQFMQSADRSAMAQRWDEALACVDSALQLDSGNAAALYRRGQILYELGRYRESRAAFESAVDEDVCPLRILPGMQDLVRRVAADLDVGLVDFASILDEESEHGIPGSDFFLDHVHPTIRSNRLLALAIVDELFESRQLDVSADWNQRTVDLVTEELESGLDETAHGIALRNLSKVMGWAGRTQEAYRLALSAVQLAPHDPETQLQAGIAYEGAERLDQAASCYRRAVELDSDFAAAFLNLGVVLAKLQRYPEAEEVFLQAVELNPESPAVLANLATVCSMRDDLESAIKYQSRAVKFATVEQRGPLEQVLRMYRNSRIPADR